MHSSLSRCADILTEDRIFYYILLALIFSLSHSRWLALNMWVNLCRNFVFACYAEENRKRKKDPRKRRAEMLFMWLNCTLLSKLAAPRIFIPLFLLRHMMGGRERFFASQNEEEWERMRGASTIKTFIKRN